MINRIVLNEMSYFGPGAIRVIPEEVVTRGFTKALVVTDKDLLKFHVAQKVIQVLENAGISYEIYDNVKPNPTIENIQSGVRKFADSKADFILAIGGGSSIDTGKGIGIVTNNPEFADVKSLEGVAATKNKSVPIIAVPTTAGTAAEVTINYVVTDEHAVKKMVCVDPKDIPVLAVIDPEMMMSMPKGLTAATGMDALTHAIEGYLTKGAWVLTDMVELQAMELIAKHLEKAVFSPQNIEARDGMGTAQYIAGMGFSNVGLGIVHSMAHSLGAIYDTPHGVANALLLPYVMEYNAPATGEKYREIARKMGIKDVDNMNSAEYRQAAIQAVVTLSRNVEIPQKLVDIGVKEEDLPKLAKLAYQDVCTPGNPRDTSEAEILGIYQKAYK
ncbi:lactaldehyde reductase [Sporomusaceae bacterium BoRhaA]|uniref:lactaldehyde reductase n=1 Tax=Pelorhabdus rhamnosifermentans TaxID=2772457 RepID=UPI001C0606A3|nr:lactaldehyde reductase [Pelorhabdus rhamnosifermentans]MBU2699688.1 lactaldehyde reductase [Pelorhabdus rhamnosifermentans]